MLQFFISLLKKRRKIFSPLGFFEVDTEVFFDWKKYNFQITQVMKQRLTKEKRETLRKINQKIRLLDDHPFLYSLVKIKEEIGILKENNSEDSLFIKELENIESKFSYNFEKKIFELRLRSILEHLEFMPYTNIVSYKELLKEIDVIESSFHNEYIITRLTHKLRIFIEKNTSLV